MKTINALLLILTALLGLGVASYLYASKVPELFNQPDNPNGLVDLESSSDDQGQLTPESSKSVVGETADRAITAMKNKDFAVLSDLAHPQKGVRFSPYVYVSDNNIVIDKQTLSKGFNNPKVYGWGLHDGSGSPINMTFKEYFDDFVYDQDFASASEVLYNRHTQRGNTTNNTNEYYTQSVIVEYYLPGTNLEYGGMDWNSLRLIFEKYNGEWKLVGIAHDEWTI